MMGLAFDLAAFASRLRHKSARVRVAPMDTLDGRLLVVPARPLDDLLELARIATERLPEHDPVASSLRGAIGQVRSSLVPEP